MEYVLCVYSIIALFWAVFWAVSDTQYGAKFDARMFLLTPVWPLIVLFYLTRGGLGIIREAELQELVPKRISARGSTPTSNEQGAPSETSRGDGELSHHD